ncbi:hypothetical protein AABB24_004403, partial [Solanum stoloniferum]
AQLTHHVSPTLPSSSSNLLQHSKLQLTLSIQKQSRNSSFTEVEKFPKSKMMKKICASIKSFEKVILLDIVERVVCGSFKDLINLRPSSKLFNTLGSEKSVYEKMDFFKNYCPKLALQRLREAKKGRHNGAAYVLAIISIFAGGGNSRTAVRFIGHMKEKLPQRKEIKQWRESLIYMIDNVWVSNPIFLTQRPDPCCTGEHENIVHVNGWPVDSDDEQDVQPCYGCGCDDKVDHVFALLPKFGF